MNLRTANVGPFEDEKLPRAVYYQCIWTVKDMERLRVLALREAEMTGFPESDLVFYEDEVRGLHPREVVLNAGAKLKCIEEAISAVPEEYRSEIIHNITCGSEFSEIAHENTWKMWKHRFIYRLARNLMLY